jgi:pyruvate dehydrogenase E2 component (dihydrolipoamide acetyltransferase)
MEWAMVEIRMPRLSDSMEAGTILTWLKANGAEVESGDALVDIETDKATVTHEAESGGILEIVVAEGETVTVDTVIARLAQPGDQRVAAQSGESQPVRIAPAATPNPIRSRAGATPLARRMAKIHGIDLSALAGTGPNGRVTKADVAQTAGLVVPAEPSRADAATDHVEEPSRLQQVVARRMTEAVNTVPDFQVQTEVVMDEAIALRARLKDEIEAGVAPSFNDLVVKASAVALRRHPRANGSYLDGRFHLHDHVHVGIAVAADDALVVAKITDADIRSLASLAAESRRLSERVRTGASTPAELSGATFTVSNLGMFGMTAITPVINPPQAAILGVGTIRDVLARNSSGTIVDRHLMTLTLTCDHRILYGADAARFLQEIRRLLEKPLGLAFA